jgi:CHASE2 domain-containing sensor protein/tetratricopeptide (TPR) repeat protein
MRFASLLILLAAFAASNASAAPAAEIVSLQGKGDYRETESADWRPARVKLPLEAGQFVRTTQPHSKMSLLLVDQTEMTIEGVSFAQVKSPDTGARRSIIEFGQGKGRFQTKTPTKDFKVGTPTGLAAIRGTEWLVEVAADGRSAFTVVEGEIEISNDLGAITVGADEEGVLERGKPPSKRRLQNARERVQWVSSFTVDADRYPSEGVREAATAIREGDLTRARTLLNAAIGRGGAPAEAYFFAADIEMYFGRGREAIAILERAAARFPGDARVPGLTARAALFADDFPRARAAAAEATAKFPDNVESRLAAGEVARLDGDYPAARVAFRSATRVAPGDWRAWHALGQLQSERSNPRSARRALAEAERIAPDNATVLAERGLVEANAYDLPRAREILDRALVARADDFATWTALGYTRLRSGDPQGALEALLRATLLEPRQARAHIYLGITYWQLGRFDDALKEMRTASLHDPKDPLPYQYTAMMQSDLMQPGEALAAARESVARLPYLKSLDPVATDLRGSANLGAPLAQMGLEAWAMKNAQDSFDPMWAGSHLFLADRMPGKFMSNSELIQGFATDPLAFGASNRFQSLLARPGNYANLAFAGSMNRDEKLAEPRANVNGLFAEGRAAYFAEASYLRYWPEDDNSTARATSITGGFGFKLRDDLGIFLYGNRLAPEVRSGHADAIFDSYELVDGSARRFDMGAHYRPSPDWQVWVKGGYGAEDSRLDTRSTESSLLGTVFRESSFTQAPRRHDFGARVLRRNFHGLEVYCTAEWAEWESDRLPRARRHGAQFVQLGAQPRVRAAGSPRRVEELRARRALAGFAGAHPRARSRLHHLREDQRHRRAARLPRPAGRHQRQPFARPVVPARRRGRAPAGGPHAARRLAGVAAARVALEPQADVDGGHRARRPLRAPGRQARARARASRVGSDTHAARHGLRRSPGGHQPLLDPRGRAQQPARQLQPRAAAQPHLQPAGERLCARGLPADRGRRAARVGPGRERDAEPQPVALRGRHLGEKRGHRTPGRQALPVLAARALLPRRRLVLRLALEPRREGDLPQRALRRRGQPRPARRGMERLGAGLLGDARQALVGRAAGDQHRREGVRRGGGPRGEPALLMRRRFAGLAARHADALIAAAAFLVVVAAATWISAWQALERRVFDELTVRTAKGEVVQPLVLVAIDEESLAELKMRWPWPRSLHAQLIDRMAQGGAIVIGLDLLLAEPSEAAEDAALAEAIRKAGNVVMAADFTHFESGLLRVWKRVEPLALFTDAGAIAGLATIPLDPDSFMRRIPDEGDAFWRQVVKVAQVKAPSVKVPALPDEGALIRYLGPDTVFDPIPFHLVLKASPEELKTVFNGRIAIVGRDVRAAPELGLAQSDLFATPFLSTSGTLTAGMKVHATMVDNALSGTWLRPLVGAGNLAVAATAALFAFLGMRRWRPLRATLALFGIAACVGAFSGYLFVHQRTWMAVATPVGIAVLAYLAYGTRAYFEEQRRKRELQQAFSLYLPPELVDQIAADPTKLELGGESREITVLFTDLAGFTKLTEKHPPPVVQQVLFKHFTAMTEVVHSHRGAVVQFIGDAIMAFWSAPLHDPDHALHAVQAAIGMQARDGEAAQGAARAGPPGDPHAHRREHLHGDRRQHGLAQAARLHRHGRRRERGLAPRGREQVLEDADPGERGHGGEAGRAHSPAARGPHQGERQDRARRRVHTQRGCGAQRADRGRVRGLPQAGLGNGGESLRGDAGGEP